jgi:uncharacterized membrane protein YhhN
VLPFVVLTACSVGALLWAESRRFRPGVWVAKPLAASGFVAAALAAGALESAYGRWVLLALILSWLGDVLLIPRGASRTFRAGLASFLLAHVIFVVAFAVRGLAAWSALVAFGALCIPLGFALRWLRPHVSGAMRIPVCAYMVVISVMVACAVGTLAAAGGVAILLGAGMFYLSDLCVARERFVASSFRNRAWGLPLYFGAQLVLASTVA